MKPQWIVAGVLGAIALVALGALAGAVGAYNSLVHDSEAVDSQAKQVDVQYQRAIRLVPQLESLSKQYLANETDLIARATALRSGIGAAQNGSLDDKDAYLGELVQVVALLGNRLEAYPQLGSKDLFIGLMDEVTNTENKIAAEKIRYNDRVQAYNAERRECCLPALVAGMFGFEKKEYIGYGDRPNTSSFGGQQL